MATNTKNSVKVTMRKAKVTRGAVMYLAPEGSAGGITNLYLKKAGLAAIGATEATEEIEVTITTK